VYNGAILALLSLIYAPINRESDRIGDYFNAMEVLA
jgi:hypothetical protein